MLLFHCTYYVITFLLFYLFLKRGQNVTTTTRVGKLYKTIPNRRTIDENYRKQDFSRQQNDDQIQRRSKRKKKKKKKNNNRDFADKEKVEWSATRSRDDPPPKKSRRSSQSPDGQEYTVHYVF